MQDSTQYSVNGKRLKGKKQLRFLRLKLLIKEYLVFMECILLLTFISYYIFIMNTVDQNATYESKKTHTDNLWRMITYCENSTDCRRAQQLEYFGEYFDTSTCGEHPGATCDNCLQKVTTKIP